MAADKVASGCTAHFMLWSDWYPDRPAFLTTDTWRVPSPQVTSRPQLVRIECLDWEMVLRFCGFLK